MKKIVGYKFLLQLTLRELELAINKAILGGYQPHGNPYAIEDNGIYHFQAMVKYDDGSSHSDTKKIIDPDINNLYLSTRTSNIFKTAGIYKIRDLIGLDTNKELINNIGLKSKNEILLKLIEFMVKYEEEKK